MNTDALIRWRRHNGLTGSRGELTPRGQALAEARHEGMSYEEEELVVMDLEPYPDSGVY